LPADPEQTGNPVLSFPFMTDIVYLYRDLRDYLSRAGTRRRGDHPPLSEFRPIRFWNDVMQLGWPAMESDEAFRWMSAQEWDSSNNLWLMLHNAEQQTADPRKLALFGVGCCRRYWPFVLPELQAILAEFEALIDSLPRPTSGEMWTAGHALRDRAADSIRRARRGGLIPDDRLHHAAANAVGYAMLGNAWQVSSSFTNVGPSTKALVAHLLRDIFGNPFRPVSLDPCWLTAEVLSLAAVVYADRQLPEGTLGPARLALLADALEEAGCPERAILEHLRGPGPHFRGCWPVDLILAKE
jgi:hypothetical protein